ncbi:MAG TPA: hypothetical protein VFV67_34185 [Actinophytocola sp.]|uniref:phage distal tail protein n=1 Tax=Actinophytocola sp. TaxID=1872138 RepID=UPI002DBB6A92|nr:hypothetical protein [Actinophytocola sp.]HEU5475718.1 hypothetical protein [Actinophytocola sp.]
MPARELVWYPAAGDPIVLNDRDAGYRVHKGATGLGVPPAQLVTDTTPLLDGEVVTDVYETGRSIMLPMTVFGATNAELRERLRALCSALDPRQPGHLELAQQDGQRRRIRGYYAAGLEGAEDRANGGDTTWYRFVLRLYCPDVFWFDPTPVVLSFPFPAPVPFFTFFPLRLSADDVLGSGVLTNPGDVAAWPIWTATPPGTAVALDNDDTGEELHVSGTLSGTLTIVTQPGEQSVDMGGSDWWSHLTGTPTFWAIPPGSTNVTLSLTGASTGSSVSCTFYPRYRSGW